MSTLSRCEGMFDLYRCELPHGWSPPPSNPSHPLNKHGQVEDVQGLNQSDSTQEMFDARSLSYSDTHTHMCLHT